MKKSGESQFEESILNNILVINIVQRDLHNNYSCFWY
jgi:hypothetical protein